MKLRHIYALCTIGVVLFSLHHCFRPVDLAPSDKYYIPWVLTADCSECHGELLADKSNLSIQHLSLGASCDDCHHGRSLVLIHDDYGPDTIPFSYENCFGCHLGTSHTEASTLIAKTSALPNIRTFEGNSFNPHTPPQTTLTTILRALAVAPVMSPMGTNFVWMFATTATKPMVKTELFQAQLPFILMS